jgi:hypothetical protein
MKPLRSRAVEQNTLSSLLRMAGRSRRLTGAMEALSLIGLSSGCVAISSASAYWAGAFGQRGAGSARLFPSGLA